MAIKFNLKISDTEIYPEAYARIIFGHFNYSFVDFHVKCYKTREERVDETKFYTIEEKHLCPQPIKHYTYIIENTHISNQPLWPSLYNYLKTLPEFEGAVDDFESIPASAPFVDITEDTPLLSEETDDTYTPVE